MRRVEYIMDEYASMVRQQRKWMLYLLVIFVLGAVITPYTPVFLGLLVGGIASYLGLILLHRNVNRLGEKVAEKGTYRGGLGTLSRLLLAGLAVLLALQYEESIHLIAVIFGLMSSYFVVGLSMLRQVFSQRH
jgi:ATP synthase protein I